MEMEAVAMEVARWKGRWKGGDGDDEMGWRWSWRWSPAVGDGKWGVPCCSLFLPLSLAFRFLSRPPQLSLTLHSLSAFFLKPLHASPLLIRIPDFVLGKMNVVGLLCMQDVRSWPAGLKVLLCSPCRCVLIGV